MCEERTSPRPSLAEDKKVAPSATLVVRAGRFQVALGGKALERVVSSRAGEVPGKMVQEPLSWSREEAHVCKTATLSYRS